MRMCIISALGILRAGKVGGRWSMKNGICKSIQTSPPQYENGKYPRKRHFHSIGAGEGRSPNSELEEDAKQWKEALQRV